MGTVHRSNRAGHGADLYYALQIPQPIPDAYSSSPSAGPIYRVGSVPPTLFASSPPPVFPPNGIYDTNTIWFLSPYYLISHPQFSRDGSVFAFMGKRVCLGGEAVSLSRQLRPRYKVFPARSH